ncbi:MAG: WG repeat-containing protein [Muribaculaceae bacterium]|nr:WG repeat-containing protein [Muribaculaceae bacterium]
MNKKTYTTLLLLAALAGQAGAQKITLNNQSRWGFESEHAGWIEIQERISDGGQFSEGLASVKKGKKWGFINLLAQMEIPPQFDEVKEFHNGFAAVRIGKMWGIIGNDGREVIPAEYDYTDGFRDGLALVKKNGKYGYINADNDLVIGFNFPMATSFNYGLAAVKEEDSGKFGYIDKNGNFKIPCNYDDAKAFEDGIAQVKAGGRKFYIDTNGAYYGKRDEALLAASQIQRRQSAQVVSNAASGIVGDMPAWANGGVATQLTISPNVATETLRDFLLRCGVDSSEIGAVVSKKLKEWQKKGAYETAANYATRVTPETIEEKRKNLYAEYTEKFNGYCRPYIQAFKDAKRQEFLSPDHIFTLNEYDAATQRYRITSNRIGDIYVSVPANRAKLFQDRWDKILRGLNCIFVPNGDDLRLAELDFAGYRYEFELPKEDLASTLMADNAAPEEEEAPVAQEVAPAPEVVKFVSDVDRIIPEGINPDASRTFAIIIGNEHYSESDCADVPYAINDATSFKEYCVRALGLPEKNIYFRTDATLNNMRRAIRFIRDRANVLDGDLKVLVYYAGHGIPNENGTDSYLLPADGIPGDYESAYQLSKFYEDLGEIPSKNTTVFLDACFSGAKRSGGMLMSARAVAVDVPEVEPIGNMVVFSAATGEETAMPYNDQEHGLFTYFLLKKLQETGGNTTYRDLYNYISDNVRYHSVVDNNKAQTPTVEPSFEMEQVWGTLVLNSEGVGLSRAELSKASAPVVPEPEPIEQTPVSVSAAAISAATEGAKPQTATSDENVESPVETPVVETVEELVEELPKEVTVEPVVSPSVSAVSAAAAAAATESAPATPPAEENNEPEISLPITPM